MQLDEIFVEIEADQSQRFYEIRNKNIVTLDKIFLSHKEASSLKTTVQCDQEGRILNLNLSTFRDLGNLKRLQIELNPSVTITCDAPFLFKLTHLSLLKCKISTYHFCILLNCVCETLNHLELKEVHFEGTDGFAQALNELNRLSKLQTLCIDRPYSEIQKYVADSLKTDRFLQSLVLSEINFEDIFKIELRRFTKNLYANVICIGEKRYNVDSLKEVLEFFHKYAADKWPTMKNGKKRWWKSTSVNEMELHFVLGVPKNMMEEHHKLCALLEIGSLKIYASSQRKNPKLSLRPLMSNGSTKSSLLINGCPSIAVQ
uniref:Uncharacterized protein n=2 Tax=Acrobeloides nanus TaxID=290746 RepID=A0A914C5N2_9BILA